MLGIEEGPPSALLQQLAKCSASTDALISSMRSIQTRFDRAEVVLQLSTRYLLVGKCDSRFAGIAHFLPTKVVYAFEHPIHRNVEMHMAYADMAGVRLQPASSKGSGAQLEFRFRISNALAYFTRDYDHHNEAHDLRIGFGSAADLRQFEQLALPHIQGLADGAAAEKAKRAATTPSRPPGELGLQLRLQREHIMIDSVFLHFDFDAGACLEPRNALDCTKVVHKY